MAASADGVVPTVAEFLNNGSRACESAGSFNSLSSGQWQIYISDKRPISSKCKWKERDPVSIERSNLVNICKLVVKELIESSLKSGRQLDSDSVPLQHFFIVLEHVLRHGLKPKRGLLGPKKELWDLFQLVERWSVEALDITASVRDLPTVNTALGRARAWLRLALMQKKLSDYFRLLLERRDDLLIDFYEPGSLMLADEAVVIMGLLVGLNVVDCNLCVKEEDLDSQMGVIDFSLYLRRGPCTPGDAGHDGAAQCMTSHPASAQDQDNLTTVLDQKNYIEELNRHLNATVSNLQARVEGLTTTNALMKEDLSIARTNLATLQEENDSLRQDHGMPTLQQQQHSEREAKRAARISVVGCEEELQDLKRQLEEERAHTVQVERELELQIQMKAESEMAAKLLEKDIHEKQDTIVSLRRQLEDIKFINLEMYQKLQECESSLRQKTELIEQLEKKTTQKADTIRKLESQIEEVLTQRDAAKETSLKLTQKLTKEEKQVASLSADLRLERDWRHALQEELEERGEGGEELRKARGEIQHLEKKHAALEETHASLEETHAALRQTSLEQERTLEELGLQLSTSKLKVADLKDVSRSLREAAWAPDKEATHCRQCEEPFNISRRRHHCRHCGSIFCATCSQNSMPLPSSSRPVRVCDSCHSTLLQRCASTD